MANSFTLEARSPCAGLLPLRIGAVRAEEMPFQPITSVMPLAGQEKSVSSALSKQLGAGLPEVGQIAEGKGTCVIWSGLGQYMVLGAEVAPIKGAALTDQSDAWAHVALEGPRARDVLARLVPMDLRDATFGEGAAARTLVQHMNAVLLRTGAARYEVMVFRSMAHTLVHDLKRAMEAVAAQR